jgi:hypothetical protein
MSKWASAPLDSSTAKPTTSGAPARCWAYAPRRDSPARSTASRTTTKRQGWRLRADPVQRAASIIAATCSAGTGSERNRRVARGG